MNEDFVMSVSGDGARTLRPSSARRLGHLRGLVAEFADRDIGQKGVALVLGCSQTAARNYLAELVDAGVVAAHPVRQAAGCMDRRLYRITADPLAVHRYLAALARSHRRSAERDDAAVSAPVPDGARIYRSWLAADFSPGRPARRDPLVAALFGAAQPS
jgi:hypothetical protein